MRSFGRWADRVSTHRSLQLRLSFYLEQWVRTCMTPRERIENALACLEEVQINVAAATFQVKEALKLLPPE